jgi:hypothetical protein
MNSEKHLDGLGEEDSGDYAKEWDFSQVNPRERQPEKSIEEKASKSENEYLQFTIKLPDDPARVEDLKLKLEEYRNRLEKQKGGKLDTVYKAAILGSLLSSGEIKSEDIAKELSDLHNGINRKDFENAVAVINDYIKTGGKLTSKPGMGLKKKK